MTGSNVTELMLRLSETQTVSALHIEAPDAFACLVLAHGAGAGMRHAFMAAVAEGLARRGVSALRYQFPYMEAGSKRVDSPPLAHVTVRAAVAAAGKSLPLFAGGKSFGGRMTSQAQAIDPMHGVRGLVFFGFPLHPAGKPSTERSAHLSDVRIPMLFLQGTRDTLAEIGLVEDVIARNAGTSALFAIDDADHSFYVPARTGRTDGQVLEACCTEPPFGCGHLLKASDWIDHHACATIATTACDGRHVRTHCASQQALCASAGRFLPKLGGASASPLFLRRPSALSARRAR